jgi:hypothetical protein
MQPLIARVLRARHASVAAALTCPKHQIEGEARLRPDGVPLFEESYLVLCPCVEALRLNFVWTGSEDWNETAA